MSHQSNHHHHDAVDGLVNLFIKANNDLNIVHNRLDKEFREIYPDNANPMKLVARIKKIQDELPSLKEQCRELLSAKQDLIDKARTTIVGNRASLQRLQTSMGIPVTNDSDDSAYTNFNEVIDEWALQVRSKTGKETHEGSDSEDINKMLFSAIVEGTW
ncbi:putative spindle and kinetochore-associated protein [Helianthus anomalus]